MFIFEHPVIYLAFAPFLVLLVVLGLKFRGKLWMFPGEVWGQIKEAILSMREGAVISGQPVRIEDEDPGKLSVRENARQKMLDEKKPEEGKPYGYFRA